MSNELTEEAYWQSTWNRLSIEALDYQKVNFKSIFAEYVKPNAHCFEVGCFPGKYLLYLRKEFGCEVSGIDYIEDASIIQDYFNLHDESLSQLYISDFQVFQPRQTYDFVFSVGFVEHFVNFEDVIRKHVELVSEDNGYLFIACPNFRGLVQYLLHWVLDRENLNRHYLPAMDLNRWKEILTKYGLTVVECRYDGTFRFWVDRESDRSPFARSLIRFVKRLSHFINSRFDKPNKYTSPYLVCVARRSDLVKDTP